MSDTLSPADNAAYKTKEYWDDRYQRDTALYDWFGKSWGELASVLTQYVRPVDTILSVGCGNSKLSEEMYEAGFKMITNIDFSPTVIHRMADLNSDRPEMKWLTMDVLAMDFADASFDVVIDKGTMDALLCDEGDLWSPRQTVLDDAHRMCSQVSRVLRPNGTYIQITFGQPHFRKKYLNKPEYGWSLATHTIGQGFHYFVYVMRKGVSEEGTEP